MLALFIFILNTSNSKFITKVSINKRNTIIGIDENNKKIDKTKKKFGESKI